MKFLNQIRQQINKNPGHHPAPESDALREALETGQRAKRAEDYPRALEALQSAMNLAHTAPDSTAIAVIALNQAEVYIQQKAWNEADQLLQKTYQNAREIDQKTQIAYLLSTQGRLAQAQGKWEKAQSLYEEALETARSTNAVGAEGRALGLLAGTYLHDANASYATHLLREALPKLNMTGDIELSSAFVGQLGEALIASGNEIEGAQLIDRALRLARQIGYKQYERYWSIALGKRALIEGNFSDSYAHLVHVLTLSKDTEPSDEIVTILSTLSKVCLSLNEQDEALTFASQAVEMSERLNDPSLISRAHGALGTALLTIHQGNPIDHLQAAANYYATLPDEAFDPSEIDILRNLAAAQGDAGMDMDAIDTFRRAATRAEVKGLRMELAHVRRDLGLMLNRLNRQQEAIHEWGAAVEIYEAERQPAQVARLLCDIGAARRYLGQGQRAVRDFEQALMTLNMVDDDWETRGLVLSNAANIYVDQGDIELSEAFFNESIAIARRLNNEAAELTRRGNYGWFLLSTGKPQQAITALEYALRMSRSLRLELQSAIQTDNLGLAYDMLNNPARAMDYHRQALELIEPLKNPHWESVFKIDLSHTLLAMGKIDAAKPLLEAALAQGRADGDVEVIVRALTGLGRLAIYQERPADVTPALDEAVNLARRADMRRCLAEALSVYSEQQARLHQPARSTSLWDEAHKLFQILESPQAKLEPGWLNPE